MVNTSHSQSQGLSLSTSTGTGRLLPPTTPMRRFLCKVELLRPFPYLALGKRHREQALTTSAAAFQLPVLGPSANTSTGTAPPRGLCLLATAAATQGTDVTALSVQPSKLRLEDDYGANDLNTGLSDSALELDLDHGCSIGGLASVAPPAPHVQPQQPHQRARLAIQQHDQPLDVIVITTLPQYPFCCHEDLLTMSRSQLVSVASLFNDHLPSSPSGSRLIDVSERTSDAHIRHCIEVLCGIIPGMPPAAPKAVKSRIVQACAGADSGFDARNHGGAWRNKQEQGHLIFEENAVFENSPPTSPLAMRLPRRLGVGGAGVGGGLGPSLLSSPSGLERLDEEDDDLEFELGDVFDSHRAFKRRKLSDIPAAPIRTLYGYAHGHGHGRTSQTSMADKMVSRTPTRRSLSSKFKLAFITHLIGHKDTLLRANDHDDDDSDADMDMDTIMSMHPHLDSPLQHRSRRAFASEAVAPLLSMHTLNVKPLAARLARSRSKSKSMSKPVKRRASNAKCSQQQHNTQICRPMGKLRMSSDS